MGISSPERLDTFAICPPLSSLQTWVSMWDENHGTRNQSTDRRRSAAHQARPGHLEHVFAAPKHTEHHAAMAYVEVPSFIQQLREHGGAPAAAFEFLILTGARAGMVRGATWNEISLDEAVWVVPARRMKSRQEF